MIGACSWDTRISYSPMSFLCHVHAPCTSETWNFTTSNVQFENICWRPQQEKHFSKISSMITRPWQLQLIDLIIHELQVLASFVISGHQCDAPDWHGLVKSSGAYWNLRKSDGMRDRTWFYALWLWLYTPWEKLLRCIFGCRSLVMPSSSHLLHHISQEGFAKARGPAQSRLQKLQA